MSIRVALGARSYHIEIATSYAGLGRRLRALGLGPWAVVVSHPALLRRHGPGLLRALRDGGWRVETLTVPAREASKSLRMAERLLGRLSGRGRMRAPVLLAFGGGVVGDLTGFVAAVYRRGVPYVQLPTTLLAQVDSAIGGKVAVDLPGAKNMVGAFYQPRHVCSNLRVLRSLPLRQRRSGLAEVIKYGAIADPGLFAYLERRLPACLSLDPAAARRMVDASCRIKAGLVSRDERDLSGPRAQLNFGHTLGHALEAATGYRRWTHGEAIAIGMCAAARLSVALGRCRAGDAERLVRLLAAAGLPTVARGVSLAAVRQAMRADKKFVRGRPRWVLLRRLGRVEVTEAVSSALVSRILRAHVRPGRTP